MEPVRIKNDVYEPETVQEETIKKENSIFPFMGMGSLIYAFFYTFCLYKNKSGITYPFFAGGTCLFFFLYLKKSGITAKKFSGFITVSLVLLGISTCLTDSWVLIALNKLFIFVLFFYLALHNLYEDKSWDLFRYAGVIIKIACSSLLYIRKPFTDFFAFRKNRQVKTERPEGKGKYVIIGILIALPLLSVILLLLGSADAVFGNLLNSMFSFSFDLEEDILGIVFLFLFAFFASYSIMSRLSVRNLKEEIPDRRTAEPVIGITFTGILSFVYLVFCFIQIVYLFGGFGTLPEKYTYASYAREGFFQLVFVCLINLGLVLICMQRFCESKLLKGILAFISFCTYIMIASSAYRMLLYIQAYCLTFLRVFVLWALLVIFLLMTGALVMIYKQDFPLVKYCLIVVTSLYLVFSFAHPDYWIARYDIEHGEFSYLCDLSMDAAPAVFEKMDEHDDYWFHAYARHLVAESRRNAGSRFSTEGRYLPAKMPVRCFNFSRWTAYHVYTEYYNEHPEAVSGWF